MRYQADLYSDTKTRPTAQMLDAMVAADIGDEQHGEDPTVDRLVERCADLLGKEAAVFVPSGTMANIMATLTLCRPGDELVAHEQSHVLNFEGANASALAGVATRALRGARGIFTAGEFRGALRKPDRHLPRSGLVVIEQTTNLGGGAIWSPDEISAISALAREAGVPMHMDGARLMNASVASGISPADFASFADSVYLDFTKGLGAPFGAVLAGDKAMIDAAWRWKQRLGGSMRQAGVMAAACLYALDNNVDRLALDHDNARELAKGLAELPGIEVQPVETNMVFLDVAGTGLTAIDFDRGLWPSGVRMSIQGPTLLRAVTHLDIGPADIQTTIEAASRAIANKEAQA